MLSTLVPMTSDARVGEFARELERRLSAELNDDALGLLLVPNVEDVFDRQRFEVETIGGVVVGRDRLRIRVDHDGLEADFAQRVGSVNAAIVELDALSDAVWSASEDHDLATIRGRHFVFDFIGRIVIRRVGLELARTGVDELVGRKNRKFPTSGPNVAFLATEESSELSIGKTETLRLEHHVVVELGERSDTPESLFHLDDLREVVDEPGINARVLVNLFRRHSHLERITDVFESLRVRGYETADDFVAAGRIVAEEAIRIVEAETVASAFEANASPSASPP